MKLTQHIPAGMDLDGIELGSFETTEELLNLPHVSQFRELVGFHRFSIIEDLLMVETSDGLDWWIVGRIDEPEKVDLQKRELPVK